MSIAHVWLLREAAASSANGGVGAMQLKSEFVKKP